jgi:hypothetical protein
VNVHVILADKGTQNPQGGTLNLLNVGWTVTQLRRLAVPSAPPSAPLVTGPQVVVVFLEAELAMCNRPLVLEIELLSEDGDIVQVAGPAGAQPVRLEQKIIVPSPPGVPTGFPGRATTMMELPTGLPLPPGIYRWQVRVGGREEEGWSARFYVAAPPEPATFGYSRAAGE